MPDKQIIINKMDKPKRYCEGIDCAWCNEKEPCIYKIANELEEKLLRKEQECEELKEDRERWKSNFNGKVSAIEELLQQLDQLKSENSLFRTCHDNEQAKRRKYEQALTEIEEIAENREIFCENCTGGVEDFTCNDCGYVKILQKISEVLKNEN